MQHAVFTYSYIYMCIYVTIIIKEEEAISFRRAWHRLDEGKKGMVGERKGKVKGM